MEQKQLYGRFFHKNHAQLVTVTTNGDAITNIRVSNGPTHTDFSLEMHVPEIHGDLRGGRFDPTNKLHVNALIFVFNVLNPLDVPIDEVIDEDYFHASPNQDWPEDERIGHVTGKSFGEEASYSYAVH